MCIYDLHVNDIAAISVCVCISSWVFFVDLLALWQLNTFVFFLFCIKMQSSQRTAVSSLIQVSRPSAAAVSGYQPLALGSSGRQIYYGLFSQLENSHWLSIIYS